MRVEAFRKALASFGCFLNFGWLNAAADCSSPVTDLSDLVIELEVVLLLEVFHSGALSFEHGTAFLGLILSPLSAKTGGFSFIFESCHVTIIRNFTCAAF